MRSEKCILQCDDCPGCQYCGADKKHVGVLCEHCAECQAATRKMINKILVKNYLKVVA